MLSGRAASAGIARSRRLHPGRFEICRFGSPIRRFYPSPRLAMKAPPEKLALCCCVRPDAPAARRAGRRRCRPGLRESIRRSSARSRCRTPATSSTISAGTPARPAFARNAPHPHVERRYLVVPGLQILAHPHPRHQARSAQSARSSRSSNPPRSPTRPATRGRTPCIAARAASMWRRSAMPRARRRAGSS